MSSPAILKKRFKSSIRRGTGEAHLIMKRNPTIDFSNDIIKASLKNFAYSGQMEGSRELYVSELIALSKQQDAIHKAILTGLATEKKDTWSLDQLFGLAKNFAKQGNVEARKAIYRRFYKKIINGSDWCGYDAILELDGLEGLKYIAEIIGKSIEKDPKNWQSDSIIHHFQRENPGIDAISELEKAAKKNKYIKIYLKEVKRHETSVKYIKPPVHNIDTLKKRIENARYFYFPLVTSERLTKQDIKILADEMLIEKDKFKKGKYLSIFSGKIKFPYDYKILLNLAEGRPNNSNRVVEFAIDALSLFSAKDIRQFAIERLNKTKVPWIYLPLFVNNYQTGDAKLLKVIAERYKKEWQIELLAWHIVAIYKSNKTKECKEPLESIYAQLTCGIHRKAIIKILIDNKVLSDKIKREIIHDSYIKTRQLSS